MVSLRENVSERKNWLAIDLDSASFATHYCAMMDVLLHCSLNQTGAMNDQN